MWMEISGHKSLYALNVSQIEQCQVFSRIRDGRDVNWTVWRDLDPLWNVPRDFVFAEIQMNLPVSVNISVHGSEWVRMRMRMDESETVPKG